MTFILFQSSNTQRVTVSVQGDKVLLNKEFRKSSEEDWKIGKGILLPRDKVTVLEDFLNKRQELPTKEEL